MTGDWLAMGIIVVLVVGYTIYSVVKKNGGYDP